MPTRISSSGEGSLTILDDEVEAAPSATSIDFGVGLTVTPDIDDPSKVVVDAVGGGGGGSGDVVGPSSSVDNQIARFHLTTGKIIQAGTNAPTYSDAGSIVMAASQTVDGRDLSVDGTKLDGIEALADVTDEANVTAAHPLSDATSLVKDPIDDTKQMRIDVGAVATETVRTLIMPNANIDLTANTGTYPAAMHAARHVTGGADVIDNAVASSSAGLMSGADKAKLDGVEAAADVTDEANVTSALPVSDATSLVHDPSTTTKRMRIDVGAVADATVRVLTMPDANIDLATGGGSFTARTASTTDNAIARFNSTAGLLQNSGVTIDDSDNIALPSLSTVDGRDVSVDGAKLDGLPTSAYSLVGDGGSSQTQRGRANFVDGNSATVVCADNSGSNSTDITVNVTTTPASQTAVGATRTITATAPITIDATTSANLSADRTIAISAASGSAAGSMSSAHFTLVNPWRKVSSGQTSLTANTTGTIATLTRNANEALDFYGYLTNNTASLRWGFNQGASGTNISLFFERTANSNEFLFRYINADLTNARTLDWVVAGYLTT